MAEKISPESFKIMSVADEQHEIFTDTVDVKNKTGSATGYGAAFGSLTTQSEIIAKLQGGDTAGTRTQLIKAARMLYAMNPIFNKIVNYFATMYYPRYYSTPRYIPFSGKPKLTGDAWQEVYDLMVEHVDGLNLDVKLVQLLQILFSEGGVYFTTFYSEQAKALDTIILPSEYAQRIGETEFGTDVIQFNMGWFDTLGLAAEELDDLLEGFPEEFAKLYREYKADSDKRWGVLDPTHSSCVLLNAKAVPTLFYAFAGIKNFEGYTQNELDKSTQALQTIVEHHIPTYQDKLLLETPEMNLLHKKLSAITRSAKNTRLVTTIGDIHVHQLLEDAGNVADKTLENAYKSIYDFAGLNNGLFYGDNQYSVEASLSIDRGYVWHLIEKLTNFYNLALNNLGIDFKGYQIELTMIPISRDKTSGDIEQYRENAKVGVGVLPFMIASGIKQKNVDSFLDMEANLSLVERLIPLRSSNTMASDFNDEQAQEEQRSAEGSNEGSN